MSLSRTSPKTLKKVCPNPACKADVDKYCVGSDGEPVAAVSHTFPFQIMCHDERIDAPEVAVAAPTRKFVGFR